jgi:hypothetical protein
MKKLLLTASLLAGLSMIAAPAMAQATGVVGVSVGSLNLDTGGTDADVDLMGIDGSVAFPVGQGLLLQGNLALSHVDDPVDGDNISGSANFGMRNSSYALGAYVGMKDNEFIDDTFIGFGGEYIYYMPQMTLSVGGGFGSFDDADADLYGVSGVGRYFVSDNLRFDGRVGFTNIDSGGTEADGIGLGIGGEWKPDNFPISFNAGYDFQTLDQGGTDLEFTVWSIGARFDFGNGTLKARDRNGPAFRPMAGFDSAANTLF